MYSCPAHAARPMATGQESDAAAFHPDGARTPPTGVSTPGVVLFAPERHWNGQGARRRTPAAGECGGAGDAEMAERAIAPSAGRGGSESASGEPRTGSPTILQGEHFDPISYGPGFCRRHRGLVTLWLVGQTFSSLSTLAQVGVHAPDLGPEIDSFLSLLGLGGIVASGLGWLSCMFVAVREFIDEQRADRECGRTAAERARPPARGSARAGPVGTADAAPGRPDRPAGRGARDQSVAVRRGHGGHRGAGPPGEVSAASVSRGAASCLRARRRSPAAGRSGVRRSGTCPW